MLMTKELLGTPIPDDVVDELQPKVLGVDVIKVAMERVLTRDRTITERQPSMSLVSVWEAQSLRDKLAIMFRRVFLSRQSIAALYPVSPDSRKVYLWYPVRLKHLLVRHGQTVWRLLRGENEVVVPLQKEHSLMSWMESD